MRAISPYDLPDHPVGSTRMPKARHGSAKILSSTAGAARVAATITADKAMRKIVFMAAVFLQNSFAYDLNVPPLSLG